VNPKVVPVLKEVLSRYDRLKGILNFPGDWGERAFRGWLVLDLLNGALGWPSERIVLGERFDILLLDDREIPVINIETKKPGRTPSPAEERDFMNRLGDYPTLQWAYLTNGWDWTRVELLAPRGVQQVISTAKFSLSRAARADAFFASLHARRYCSDLP
jgi:hypothetical protein